MTSSKFLGDGFGFLLFFRVVSGDEMAGLLTSVVLVGQTPTVAVSFQPTRVVGKNRWDFLRRKEFLLLMVQKSG